MTVAVPSASAVRGVITTSLTDEQIGAFIDDAALIAEGCDGIVALAEARQTAIVKWLTAHLISQRDGQGGQKTAERLGDAGVTFAHTPGGLFLKATRYGQQACALDTSGQLSAVGNPPASLEFM